MTCRTLSLENGTKAIVCTSGKRQRCTICGNPASQLCDWKVAKRASGTCDTPVCARCSFSPVPDKDLCPVHADAWRNRQSDIVTPDLLTPDHAP